MRKVDAVKLKAGCLLHIHFGDGSDYRGILLQKPDRANHDNEARVLLDNGIIWNVRYYNILRVVADSVWVLI